MKRSYRLWVVVVALVALAPAGLRALTWQKHRPQPIDAQMAQAGERLFLHEWKAADSLTPDGDGLGPVFNATSCVACHHQVRPGGGGGLEHNVTTFTVSLPGQLVRTGVVHAFGIGVQETLRDIHPSLPAIARPRLEELVVLPGARRNLITMPKGVQVSQRNTPALFGVRLIDEMPDRYILANEKAQRLRWGLAPADGEQAPVGRALRLTGGNIGKFGWKAQVASLGEFVQTACAVELGLGNPAHAQPAPLGRSDYQPRGLDLTQQQCDEITTFVASLVPPVEKSPVLEAERERAASGKQLFGKIGCADCHTPDVGPVQGIYSDLLLHRMGQDLVGGGYYGEPAVPVADDPDTDGPSPSEWRTPPLWGVADSAPYLHDGRAPTLEDAIKLHGGQGAASARRFAGLLAAEQEQLIAFLKTLRAP